ncbi:transposase, partial [Candidatus Dependentiae bacterium]|nr:transposase [Candidatus Dependentiae bacterium]
MKRGVQGREKKWLSARGLLTKVRSVFEKVKDKRNDNRGIKQSISTSDALMSAVAMFSLKCPSLLAFDQAIKDPTINHNLKSLYFVKQAPSDTYMRELLDEVAPSSIRGAFTGVFEAAQRGKLLSQYAFLDGFLLVVDGTGFFESKNVQCSNCCVKNHRDGSVTHYHQALTAAIVNPDMSQVIPLCPEMINKQDGAEKNDCERRALSRFLGNLKTEHPRLKLTIAYDALAANAPTINE